MIIINGATQGGGGGEGLPVDGSVPMEAPITFNGEGGLTAESGENLNFKLGDDAGSNYITLLNEAGLPVAYFSSLGGILCDALTAVTTLNIVPLDGGGKIPYSEGVMGTLIGDDDFNYDDETKTFSVDNLSLATTGGDEVLLMDALGDVSGGVVAPAHADTDGDVPQFGNIVFSVDDPPAANTVPEGTLYIKYVEPA